MSVLAIDRSQSRPVAARAGLQPVNEVLDCGARSNSMVELEVGSVKRELEIELTW